MVKIPYGTSNFGSLITQGYYYIDRTHFIVQLEQLGEKYIAYLRPRRFGKSLWLSTLQHYYGLEYKNKFNDLFGSQYIGKHPTPLANSFLVLKFDFSGIHTETLHTTREGFVNKVKSGIGNFMAVYKEYFTEEEKKHILTHSDAHEMITRLSDHFRRQGGDSYIYILIDEYDHFANELISFRFSDYRDVVSRNGYVRKFYEAIKTATAEGIVDRIFLTGVSPITLDSFTSGFNISRNLTLDRGLQAMMGFTESEVENLLLNIGISEAELPSIMADVKQWYDGYLFHSRAAERLYNPDMVLYFAIEYQKEKRYPENILDTNVVSDYGKLQQLFRIGEVDEQHYEVIEALVEKREVSAKLTPQFSFDRTFKRDDFVSLLFYMGMLTIREPHLRRIVFQFPNYVIEELYYQYFSEILLEKTRISRSDIKLSEAVEQLAMQNNILPFVAIVEKILISLSNRDSIGFDEKHIKAIIVSLFHMVGIYTVKSEYETDRKYVDILLKERPPVKPNYTIAIELKYLPKSETARLTSVKEEGVLQLKSYLQHDELKRMPNLKGWLLVFVGTEARFVEPV
ncbi:MAG: AAA family ATPase [Bacteroidia bacterium]|nr:AAA family ATPase [Bacteroidia bacterium]